MEHTELENNKKKNLKVKNIFYFIEETDEHRTKKTTLLMENSIKKLEEKGISGFCPKDKEDEKNIVAFIDKTQAIPDVFILSITHSNFFEIMNMIIDNYPDTPVIYLYPHEFKHSLADAKDYFLVKLDLCSSKLSSESLSCLFLKIEAERMFNEEYKNSGYKFIKNLSNGASGIIDLYDEGGVKTVVIKKIGIKESQKTKMDKEKINQQIEHILSINIPTIVTTYQIKVIDEYRFVIMEYINGKNLSGMINDYCRQGQKFDTDMIFDFLIQILLALYTLNKKGLIYKDLKTENILVKTIKKEDKKEKLIFKLSDLGISRTIDNIIGSLNEVTEGSNSYYVSPEIGAKEEKIENNTDIWSLGVILYELITLHKPWMNYDLSNNDFIELVMSKEYPELPNDVDEKLRYLVSIMLKKDPSRRANLKDILCLDFIHDRYLQVLKDYDWENIEEFKFGNDIKRNIYPLYKTKKIMNEDDENALFYMNKLCCLTYHREYKINFFKKVKDALRGDDLFNTFMEIKDWTKDKNPDSQKESFKNKMKEGILKKIIKPLSHKSPNNNNITDFMNKFIESPSEYYFQSNCGKYDLYNESYDNPYLIEGKTSVLEKTNFLVYSQFVLYLGLIALNECPKERHLDSLNFAFNKNYLNFLVGISNFQKCDPMEIPYNSKNKDRLAFFCNLYQIFGIHCHINNILFLEKVKPNIYGVFQNDIKITYKFKKFTLNHLEILNIIFRNNKPIPGNFFPMVYSSDVKCKLLPILKEPAKESSKDANDDQQDYNKNLLPLFLAYRVNKSFYTIYTKREVEKQLEERILKLIPKFISLNQNTLMIFEEFKPYFGDFGSNCDPSHPIDFVRFLVQIVKKTVDCYESKKGKKLYLTQVSKKDLEKIKYIDDKLLKRLEENQKQNDNIIEVKYFTKREENSPNLSII